MFYRRKLLLGLLEAFGGNLPRTDFQKYLFLYTQKCQSDKSYHFVPYLYGCFSFQSYADKRKLVESGYLSDIDDWKLRRSKGSYLSKLDNEEAKKIRLFVEKYKKISGKTLIRHVYSEYPYYAIKSTIAESVLNQDELTKVKKHVVSRRKKLLATVGYEGLSIEEYLNKLIKNDIRILVDVRKNPVSRKYGFSKSKLSDLLGRVGIAYMHVPELGIDSHKRQNLDTQKDYDRIFRSYENTVLKRGHEQLVRLHDLFDSQRRIALTCFEASPTMCHRHKVADALSAMIGQQVEVTHL